MQHGPEFSIMVGRLELMNSRRGRSEEALATLACEQAEARYAAVIAFNCRRIQSAICGRCL